MKTMLALLALLATSGTASAGGWIHAGADAGMGVSHTVDIIAGGDGTVIVLVDGAPIGAPTTPELPATPSTPALPQLPALPALPSAPAAPALPGIPALP